MLLARKHPRVLSQLPLAAMARGRPRVSERAIRRGTSRATRLERLGRRSAWRTHITELLRDAYILGLRHTIPSDEEFQAFVGPVWNEPPTTVVLDLSERAPTSLPAFGAVEIAVRQDGKALGRVVALDPGSQWDWRVVTDRIVGHVSDSARTASVLAELDLVARDPGETALRASGGS